MAVKLYTLPLGATFTVVPDDPDAMVFKRGSLRADDHKAMYNSLINENLEFNVTNLTTGTEGRMHFDITVYPTEHRAWTGK